MPFNIVRYYVFRMVSSEAKILVLATLIVCVILIADIFTYLLLFFFFTNKGVWETVTCFAALIAS